VIQCVAEVLWLLVLSGVAISLTLLLLRTGTTVTTLTTVTALTTLTTVTTLATLTALTTGWTLYVVSGLLNQHAV
jgi:hypothetical protein